MESEKPHRTTSSSGSNNSSSGSELFVCFTSRLSSSSSSMKISSKSILSPGRAREASQLSLSSSLSRRLKNSGSIKGGQASPMFPTGGKKRGCGFDNPEPSSPKVTCIGQVRVKTKKQGKKMRTRSKRRSGSNEASFRKSDQSLQSASKTHQENENEKQQFQLQQQEYLPANHRNQRWVHLPLTICEALRSFGAEFNCFLPCRSSCTTSSDKHGGKEEKGGRSESGRSCGAVFARWLVALQDGDGRESREIELVVEEEQERSTSMAAERRISSSSRRRHIFEGIEIKDEAKGRGGGDDEEEEGRVSICIPPKNALLLMRCRSDPVKMAALANRFWESPAPPNDEENEVEDEDEDEAEDGEGQRDIKERAEGNGQGQAKAELVEAAEALENKESDEEQANFAMEEEEEIAEENPESTELDEVQGEIGGCGENPRAEESDGADAKGEEEEEEFEVNQQQQHHHQVEDESLLNVSLREIQVDAETMQDAEDNAAHPQLLEENGYDRALPPYEEEETEIGVEERRASVSKSSSKFPIVVEKGEDCVHGLEEVGHKVEAEIEVKVTEAVAASWSDKDEEEEEETREMKTVTHKISKPENPNSEHKVERESGGPVLPDCLLLMMCEPKLSMEVSKETWVCSTDFVRWLPDRKVNQNHGPDEPKKHHHQQQQLSIVNIDGSDSVQPSKQASQLMQPPRSSCSFPMAAVAPASMATVVEEKLVGGGGSKAYEPFVLTRCKSEPMRSSAKFAPTDACFWKNRKLEPHRRPATLGVGAAGVGF